MADRCRRSSIHRRMTGGLLAVVFLCIALVGFYFSFAHVLLDLAGTSVAGRVVEVRASSVWQRFRMNTPVLTVRYSFDVAGNGTVTGQHAVAESTWRGLATGSAVTVEYLSLLPALSRVERPDRGFLFFVFAALTLVCLWLAGKSITGAFVRPPA